MTNVSLIKIFKCRELLFSLTFSGLFSVAVNNINHDTAINRTKFFLPLFHTVSGVRP